MHNDNWDPGRENRRVRGAAWALALFFAYLPLSAILGAAHFGWGARAYAPDVAIHLALRLIFHALVLTPVIAWPAVANEPSWPDSPRRTALVVGLLSAPLLSLAYYVGDIRDVIGALDALWTVVPPVGIAVAHFRAHRNAGVFVAILGLATFASFYLVGDRLGALPTLVAYDSRGSFVYSLRVLCAVASLVIAYRPLRWRRPSALGVALAAVTAGLMARSDATVRAQIQLMVCAAATLLVLTSLAAPRSPART